MDLAPRHDDSDLFHGSVKLVEVYLTSILNVEEFEHLLQEFCIVSIVSIFLHNFSS